MFERRGCASAHAHPPVANVKDGKLSKMMISMFPTWTPHSLAPYTHASSRRQRRFSETYKKLKRCGVDVRSCAVRKWEARKDASLEKAKTERALFATCERCNENKIHQLSSSSSTPSVLSPSPTSHSRLPRDPLSPHHAPLLFVVVNVPPEIHLQRLFILGS